MTATTGQLETLAAAARNLSNADSLDEALAALAPWYLDAHGPATARDFAWWSGQRPEAAEAALAAVAQEPLRESAHRLVMEAHLADGNPGEAVRHYRLFARLLGRQLGLQPSPRMRALLAGLPVDD
jgi:DNA-binding SARP family transcriptional activator